MIWSACEVGEPFGLVHPAFVVGFWRHLVGVDVAAVLVEVDFAVLLAHVDLELAGGAATLLAVVGVADSEKRSQNPKARPRRGAKLTKRKPQSAPESWMQGTEGVGLFQQHADGDKDVDRDHVLGLDSQKEPEKKFLIAEEHGDRNQEPEDAGPGSDRADVGTQAEDVRERDGRGDDVRRR